MLEYDLKRARELGLSYGQYKALNYDPDAVAVKTDGKICPVCGKVVENKRRKYCSKACSAAKHAEQRREFSRKSYMLKGKRW